MPESQAITDPAFDAERTAVESSVMRATKGDEVVRIVLTALGPRLQVMQVDVDGMSAPRNHAAPVITPDHQSPDGRWNTLHRAR